MFLFQKFLRSFAGLLFLSVFLVGCSLPVSKSPSSPPVTNKATSGASLELTNDCLGLTSEKIQAACGSGPVTKPVNIIP